MSRLELDGLTRAYGTVTALDHLSFSVTSGQVTGFLGPNGAGKTTAMRAVFGLMKSCRAMSSPTYTRVEQATAVPNPNRSARNPVMPEGIWSASAQMRRPSRRMRQAS